MPKKGDSFTVELKKAHLEWGSYRHTNTRKKIYGEGYIHIPREYAKLFNVYNNNSEKGAPYYLCSTLDGFLLNETIMASGSSTGGDIYAKQFQGQEDLKLLGRWFEFVSAQEGDCIKVTWTSDVEILLEIVK